jgi:8-oxo-dGTP diphosphatase
MSTKPFNLAVRAVIFDEQGRCLLVRRSAHNRSFVGTWEWPGGKADPGETFDAAVRREVAEEAGLQIELTGVAGAFLIEMAQMHLAVLCMEAKACGGELRLSDEHDQSAWVPLAELSKWNLTAGFRDFAEGYVKRFKKEHAT